MTRPDDGLFSALLRRGVSRRAFLRFCAAMTATLALPVSYVPRVAAAVKAAPRIPVIWLRGQGCGGDGEALLLASNPSVGQLLLDTVSIEYIDALMAPSGSRAERSWLETMEQYPNGYFAVIEGAVPAGLDGYYCTTGSRPFRDLVREVSDGALATFAVGSCAVEGGLAAAAGGPTGAQGVGSIAASERLLNLPGCPVNSENLTAAIVHYLTFKELPPRDGRARPLFAYGAVVHNQCERRAHFEFGEFVLEWGDEAAQKGWCLYKMGCKGPETYANCPTARYGEGTSWPVKAGHGCVGCTMPAFWDSMSPFYLRLPPPLPFAPDVTADQVGQAAVGGVAALTAVHGVATIGRSRWRALRQGRARGGGRSLDGDGAVIAAEQEAAAEPQPGAEPAGGGTPQAAPEPQPAAEPASAAEPQAAATGEMNLEPRVTIEPAHEMNLEPRATIEPALETETTATVQREADFGPEVATAPSAPESVQLPSSEDPA